MLERDEKYFSSDAISASDLDMIHRSPMHFRYFKNNPEPPTPAMEFGSQYHTLVLEPAMFDKQYQVISRKPDRRSKAGKEEWEEILDDGRPFILSKDYEVMTYMREVLLSHQAAGKLLNGGDNPIEEPIYGELQGVKTRIKPDLLRLDLAVIIDLKTAIDACYNSFQRTMVKFRYHVHAAFYLDNAHSVGYYEGYVFIVQEKTPPYAVAVYELDQESLEKGRLEYQVDLARYKDCLKRNEWYGYGSHIMTISLPKWA